MSHSHSHGHSHDDHSHDHSHAPTVTSDNERKVLLSFFLILTFMIVEVIGGLISGSLALLADAGHMLSDAAALARMPAPAWTFVHGPRSTLSSTRLRGGG